EQIRARLGGVCERQAAADGSCRRPAGPRCVGLRADGISVRLAPLRLVVAHSSAELGHLRSPRHAVVSFPAVRSLELFLGGSPGHAGIVESMPVSLTQYYTATSLDGFIADP